MNDNQNFQPSGALEIPILFIIFTRKDTSFKVFERIREARPKRLYIAADGPRPNRPDDIEKCAETRQVVDKVDWDCELFTLFREENVGCGKGPAQAMDWFFEHEEMGIIMEDDIMPDMSFFRFCQEMLERYKDDERIMQVSGMNFVSIGQSDSPYSYHFSRAGSTWGWATWRRCWQKYDYDVPLFKEMLEEGYLDNFFFNTEETSYVLGHLESAYDRNPSVTWWDYQWEFCKYINSGLCVVSSINMIENIGFGEDATHTIGMDERYLNIKPAPLGFPLKHPDFVLPNSRSDQAYFERFYSFSSWQRLKNIVKKFVPDAVLKNAH